MTGNLGKALAVCVMAALLAGCAGGIGTGLGIGTGRKPPQTIAVAGGAVTIGGPRGYCIDRTASRVGGDSPFVLLGSCASIAGDRRAGAPSQPGILTAAVSGPGEGADFAATLPELEAFLTSPQGRSALARDGRPGSVEVLSTRRDGEALLIHLRDASANPVPGTEPTYWRGLFAVNGRLVTVSVMSFADQPMGSDTGLGTLMGLVARIRGASASG